MMQKRSSIDCSTVCRPLITSVYQSGSPKYVDLPYNYQMKDIKSLQTYLCSSAKICGIDFESPPPISISRSKYKIISVQGKIQSLLPTQENKQNSISWGGNDLFLIQHWQVDVCISIPSVLKPSFSDELPKFIQQNLLIFAADKPNKKILQQDYVTLKELTTCTIEMVCRFSKAQLAEQKDKSRVLVNRIPVSIILPKIESYEKSKIKRMISQDIGKSICIMLQSQLLHRKVGSHENTIPIHTYLKDSSEKDPQFEKLISKPLNLDVKNRMNQALSKQKTGMQAEKIIRKNNNMFQVLPLIALLILVIGAYVVIKFT